MGEQALENPTTKAGNTHSDGKEKVRSSPAPRQLATPTDLKPEVVKAITDAVNALIADAYALISKPRTSTGMSRDRTFPITICSSTSRPRRSLVRSMCWPSVCGGLGGRRSAASGTSVNYNGFGMITRISSPPNK